MIEIKYEEKEKVDNLYNEIKDILLLKKDKDNFTYQKKQHHLYEESKYPGISKNYFNENGKVEFENINGEKICIEISRWHPHKHNGFSGLNVTPCLKAKIYRNEQIIWELEVRSGTLTYHAEVTNLEIPRNILKEQIVEPICQEDKDLNIDDNKSTNDIVEPIETRILFNELKKLQTKSLSTQKLNEHLLAERDKEIKKETERIIKHYEEKLKQNNAENSSTKKQLKELEKDISKYSTFDLEVLGKCLEKLISIFEGEDFLYKESKHTSKITKHGAMDSWEEDVETKVKMVIRESKWENNYNSPSNYDSVINNLVNEGNVIILEEKESFLRTNNKITIYSLQDNQLVSNINFGKFDYVKEFIQNMIQFRFQNNKTEFNENDILSYMKKFVLDYKEKILEKQNKKFEEKILKLSMRLLKK